MATQLLHQFPAAAPKPAVIPHFQEFTAPGEDCVLMNLVYFYRVTAIRRTENKIHDAPHPEGDHPTDSSSAFDAAMQADFHIERWQIMTVASQQ